MRDERYLRYIDEEVEILLHGDHAVVKDRKARIFYETDSTSLPADLDWKYEPSRLSKAGFLIYWSTLAPLLIVNLMFAFVLRPEQSLSSLTSRGWAIAVGYLAAQLLIHESAHLVAFRYFGRRHDKVGFKLNFAIFPAFYVRMNDSHLLLPSEKFLVHTAGLFGNSVIGVLFVGSNVFFEEPAIVAAASLFSFGLWANTLPILRSDGHKTLLTLLGIREKKRLMQNSKQVIWLHFASWVFALILSANAIHRLI